jgi:DNA-directed RNA polymerase subunit RPC12/RpoP
MPIRIVGHGKGYDTHILDAETGQDLTHLLHVSSVTLNCTEVPTAQLTALLPQVDVVVQEATLLQRCPYCGHERISKIHSASDLEPVNRRLLVKTHDLDNAFLDLTQVQPGFEEGV